MSLSVYISYMYNCCQVLPIENSMKNPDHFLGCPGVLNISMSVVVCLYAFVGFCGYLKYGDATDGSVTLNLPVDELWAIYLLTHQNHSTIRYLWDSWAVYYFREI